ncbi:Hypothetical Protein FCC1311_052022 [Hondaea fermentalgiana]|uniref:Uncharacterized protein n=1 Tax=Hondaea fermentalgiana TaxID=2315210 RepID=A0A2R5GL25_9STRA|nr:Hypothetical Protein FCC1311_052022 [Hondaea fermentalgiana]|eukprot:GBG28981.1 Hypothetical Protein FCC1311_052022 [Hondaea fermentalgiana]
MDTVEKDSLREIGNEENCAFNVNSTLHKGSNKMMSEASADDAQKLRGKQIDDQIHTIVRALEDIEDNSAIAFEDVEEEEEVKAADEDSPPPELVCQDEEVFDDEQPEESKVLAREEEKREIVEVVDFVTKEEKDGLQYDVRCSWKEGSDVRASLFALVVSLRGNLGLEDEEALSSPLATAQKAPAPPFAKAQKEEDAETELLVAKEVLERPSKMTVSQCNWQEGSEARGMLFALAVLDKAATFTSAKGDMMAESNTDTDGTEASCDENEEDEGAAPPEQAIEQDVPAEERADEQEEKEEIEESASAKSTKKVNFQDGEKVVYKAAVVSGKKASESDEEVTQAVPVDRMDPTPRECSCALL